MAVKTAKKKAQKTKKKTGKTIGSAIGGAIGDKIEKEIEKEMQKENSGSCCIVEKKTGSDGGGAGAVYGLAFIGAAVYYIQTAAGFWEGALGVLKALVWPAFLIYKLLGM